MANIVKVDPWRIIENKFDSTQNLLSESIFSIGNGKMGQRANFEEDYTGESLIGNYVAGIYYPDKTRVGWWKNGYPEYFAKVLNSVEWIGLHIKIDGILLDLNTCDIQSYKKVLDMQKGILQRDFTMKLSNNKSFTIKSTRFYSMINDEICTLNYNIQSIDFEGKIEIESYLNFNVQNQDSNYDENFWTALDYDNKDEIISVKAQTKKTDFIVKCGLLNEVKKNNIQIEKCSDTNTNLKVSQDFIFNISAGDNINITKYVSITSSFYYKEDEIDSKCFDNINSAKEKGFLKLQEEQEKYWLNNWSHNDIKIEGDDSAQQAMRFNIFQLNQTYTGVDDRLNIGPKGFTGEKYGGSTYWDTEAYCLPFYQATAPQKVSKNLLLYRYKQLGKAIENATKLGFSNGAALYPMVTMNGEECHNEWEITFEEIHRNGAIAYAIYDYVRYTEDTKYLADYGLEVLIAISRFWAQRVHFSEAKKQYVMHGVTGPNEYENNVNNNWYTSYIARWCLQYTMQELANITDKGILDNLYKKINFKADTELKHWKDISSNIYLPEDKERGVFLQQDGFLDKELIPVGEMDQKHLPLVHNWSWDRILRSCYIKQADVLQGMYFFEDHFTKEALERNFDFYEPLTVHESSLSPCVHSILAARIDRPEKSYEMFMRTARLDLDNLNSDSEDGCHITSMAGTWLAFVKGIGGMKIQDGQLSLSPFLPNEWDSYTFTIGFRDTKFEVNMSKNGVTLNVEGKTVDQVYINGHIEKINEGINNFTKNK